MWEVGVVGVCVCVCMHHLVSATWQVSGPKERRIDGPLSHPGDEDWLCGCGSWSVWAIMTSRTALPVISAGL